MFAGSNAVQTAVLMLAHKRIEHEVVHVERGAHVTQMPELGFSGTTRARAADRRAADPGDPRDRSRARRPQAAAEALSDRSGAARARRGRRAPRRGAAERRPPPVLLGDPAHGAHARCGGSPPSTTGPPTAAARRDLAELPARLDEIDAWLADGILGGDALNAADFQIAPNVAWLPCFEDLAPLVAGRPALAHAERVAGRNESHVPAAFPREWLTRG